MADRTRRLGNLRGGTEDVKNHAWLQGVDWQSVYDRQIPAPIIPVTSHMSDTSNFETYPDSEEDDCPSENDPFHNVFQDF
jgi:hypothetical protein